MFRVQARSDYIANQPHNLTMPIRAKFDPIEYLLSRRFGVGKTQRFPTSLANGPLVPTPVSNEQPCPQERAAYERELRELSSDDLKERVRAALAEDIAAREARFDFNLPKAQASSDTFRHWAKAAYWNTDESVALLMGRNPDCVSWKFIHPVTAISQVASQFSQLRDLMLRAQTMSQLLPRTVPGMVIAWAKRNRIDVPPGLEEAVREHGHQVADWKTAYDVQKTRAEVAEAALREMQQKVEQLRPLPAEKGLSTKERESLLKMIIVMAVDGYGYKPSAARSPFPGEIADQLARRGMSLSEDTVRKYLKEAKGLLPHLGDSD